MNTPIYAVKDADGLLKEFRKIIKEELSGNRKEDPDNQTEFIKIDEVCKILQVSKPTVYDWAKRKLLKIYKVRSRTYFNKVEILNFLKSQK